MYKQNTFLAIIPARSGSKGLKDKNIKKLCGKPLLAWSIESANNSKYIDEIAVSTDSNKYLKIAKEYGVNTPFLRPKELAEDTTTTFDSIKHTIDYYKNVSQKEFDYIVLLEPTSPLREASDIDNAIEMLLNSSADSIVGICRCESQNPAFLVKKDKEGFISGYKNKDMKVLRRQEIDDLYFFEGSIYISKCSTLLDRKTFYHKKTIGYEVPKYKSFEIDDIVDFIIIEALIKYKRRNNDLSR
ncbi:acylneuraminate cytidylyltransferase family protein [Campylobacter hyointestinalis subsp. hyointestinalis]|uniref:acylneuraminate cytidylyltransferase family protein n=1 Tax=Campylobacter hyointestinalis TaxID=198 RepID=UPI00072685D7|nr:acylneuraminate cytidylyltransferase family protein [Campylobacter hyointestinalis]PPB57999.1 acylneuraminate cytidylyltransferase [Campylobacter hyointestinalis subsp. hyointestinalis]QCT99163.1 acylneuraminate cytidylyltransferase family protein [Campylobacter hyointestinalis subsp. hyointestinalis]CUU67841.1 N-acylneuraminate cytidylyltransferase [Campylobacter hyointestinalis subsp. hyointestinalis]